MTDGRDVDNVRRCRFLAFVSDEWLTQRVAEANTIEATPGVNVVIQHEVLGGPAGPIEYVDYVQDGRLADCRLGQDSAAEVTVTNTWQDELAVMRGDVDPFDVIIEGRLAVAGDQARLLQVVPIMQRPATQQVAQRLAELAEAGASTT